MGDKNEEVSVNLKIPKLVRIECPKKCSETKFGNVTVNFIRSSCFEYCI